MKVKATIYIFCFLFLSLLLMSAGKDLFTPTPLTFSIPKDFPKLPKNIFKTNPLTEEGFQLGKKLFYDGRLSKDGQVSCASCHQQFAGFSTYDHDLSHGVNNTFTNRNAPALINLAWMTAWHWDGGINHIEVQPLSPLTAENEMGERLDSVLLKMKADTVYTRMFTQAFGTKEINSQLMLKALAQFTGSLVSADSKYDKVKRGEAKFEPYEQKGYELFKANCNTCHKEPLFTDNSFHNNGMPLNRLSDIGRQKITMKKEDSLKFKTPTLRNISLTKPYMHDGSLLYLEKVMDHYTKLDISKANLDPLLKKKIILTDKEKTELISFLSALTDTSFTKNKRFAP